MASADRRSIPPGSNRSLTRADETQQVRGTAGQPPRRATHPQRKAVSRATAFPELGGGAALRPSGRGLSQSPSNTVVFVGPDDFVVPAPALQRIVALVVDRMAPNAGRVAG